jgi:hypothetical protein
MIRRVPKLLLLAPFFLLLAMFLSIFTTPPASAQLSGCGQIDVGNPGANVSIPPQCASGSSGGLTNPFPDGFVTSRLDMGEDGTFKNRIVAPFSGTITYAANSFSNWGGYIELKADRKPAGLPTSTLYFAEGVGVVVRSGHVQAGQTIAKPVPSVWNGIIGNIEWGVAQDGSGLTDTYSKVAPNPRQMVLDFAKWAESLHVPPPTSTSQAGYP